MKFMRLAILLGLVSLIVSTSIVFAQGSDSGTLTVYTALEDDQIQAYLAPFYAQYPNITVNIVRDSTGVVTARLLAEKDNPQADLIWGLAATSLLVLDQEGMLEPYAPAGLENIDPRFRDPSEVPVWVGIDAWETVFCVNTIEIERLGLPMPESWADLIKPEYKGYIVMPNPNSSGTGFLSVAASLQMADAEGNIQTLIGENAAEMLELPTGEAVLDMPGWAYLDALDQNIAVYTHSGSKPCRMAGAGEYPIGISFGYRAVRQARSGEPIVGVWPAEGSGWDLEANALIKKDTINPAAYTFLDWAISEEAMALYATNYPITAFNVGLPVPEGYPENAADLLIYNDLYWAAAHREIILTEWLKRYDAKSEAR
jgi:iron(III) transport system substrate-binding protein